jgi:MoxR-like ATPase
MINNTYINSTPVCNVAGVNIYMADVVEACLKSRLNLFLIGDTGFGKTQLGADVMSYFPGKHAFILGRNDMNVRDLFVQINLEKMRSGKTSRELKEVTEMITYNLIVVDELPNCVPAVRAQLFNLFDGYIDMDGVKYDIGKGYSIGIATGNIGQKFTESSNDLGRALKDRMHVIIDVDYFRPTPSDLVDILDKSTDPRVHFATNEDRSREFIEHAEEIRKTPIPFDKLVIANYLVYGLNYCISGGRPASKVEMKENWPNMVDNHGQGSDEALVLPVSPRAIKSIIRLSKALEDIARQRLAPDTEIGAFDSMMQAYKLIATYSGILNDGAVQQTYNNNKYAAIDAVIATTRAQFDSQQANFEGGLEMLHRGETDQRVLELFTGRWGFMRNMLEGFVKKHKADKE